MIATIKQLFGLKPATDFKALVNEGAIILDVRTKQEFSSGHVKGAVNIPVDQLSRELKKLKNKQQPIITCCASGMRSSRAKSYLASQGYTNVHNGGAWQSLNQRLQK